jgi:Conserved protein/domain typically associated with flavoprotein oxygenases, DIM6/NTAB family
MIDQKSTVDAMQFRMAMRLPATAVTVIATGTDDDRNGLTASAVCSLSDSPPMILACVNLKNSALSTIRARKAFSANFLTAQQASVAELFAGRTRIYGAMRFSEGAWTTLFTGVPVLSNALAAFDCVLECEYESPTHAMLVGRVMSVLQNSDSPELVYRRGEFCRSVPLPMPTEQGSSSQAAG